MCTLREFKDHILMRAGASSSGMFCIRSHAHALFWVDRVNSLAEPLIAATPDDALLPPDVDAAVNLTDQQWEELDRELGELLGK